MAIGSLTLTPTFAPTTYEYTASTSNATNNVSATKLDATAILEIKVNNVVHTSGNAATWLTGENTVTVRVQDGTTIATYTVIVTKSGELGALTVASAEGTDVGDTAITVTEDPTVGCTYKYKTAASVAAPALDDVLTTGWAVWDGEADIVAANGHEICIAEVDYANRTKTAGKATVVAKIIEPLTVSSAAGTNQGDTKITIAETITEGNTYVYKTAETVAIPALDTVLTTGWTAWDGTADITATTDNEIVIAEIDATSKAKKAGKDTVVSKA